MWLTAVGGDLGLEKWVNDVHTVLSHLEPGQQSLLPLWPVAGCRVQGAGCRGRAGKAGGC